ncbi:alpha-amylase family glycosyl hydrolase [Marinobacter xestospongiae]|uniref:Alpha-amylase family glycosyl hydrolase n=1 Tax=Marinobacter xestospongiae TaxID=994319 RepID=A0ABU3VUL0_9GAMM|nr:alpha-amylase family glycosyl hydrolase [Marinobacter xestospongiae]MDV2077687.1 alpha-amylase family glycosyl hydrolase [Marinobacter xestospongiae]
MAQDLRNRLMGMLELIYPDLDSGFLADRLITTMGLAPDSPAPPAHQNNWTEADVLLITYADTVQAEDEKPLATLRRFLREQLADTVSAVHILPFFPYSSDDGFAVMDYLAVNESHGDWRDIEAIGRELRLMADLVINHMSARSRWFENFRRRLDPGRDYFVEADPAADVSQVVRPRTSPLLNPVQTDDGERHVWCTFSEDQVDLNFRNPEVLLAFVGIIRHYLERGVLWFRLDAVAFLWKEVGTRCIHLQQTHELIKVLRLLIEHHTPTAVVITETNVPNRENLTYFGNANEAHVIYNFSLPPLLIHTLVTGNCRHLKTWLMSMPPAQLGTTYLNFIASHDGIGMRPTDGLLSDTEKQQLIATMERFGGKVSYRQVADGSQQAYEINIALYDAMKGTVAGEGGDAWQLQRFLCAHAIMLALEGIPALYIHSLVGTGNDYARMEHTGRLRSINRAQWPLDRLQEALANPLSHHSQVFGELRRLIEVRRRQPAFHPNATQFTLHLGLQVFGFWRQSLRRDQSIFCIYNVTDSVRQVSLSDINLIGTDRWRDLISGQRIDDLGGEITLKPYQAVWLSNRE